MIHPETIQKVIDTARIEEVVGEYVRLRKSGSNLKGLCPFHHEKTPSFMVSPAKGIFKCFGCGASGNSVGFVMDHEKYSYVESLRWLAAKYNIAIEETESSPEQKAYQQVSESLFIVNHFAKDFFKQSLLDTEEGKNIALSYLEESGELVISLSVDKTVESICIQLRFVSRSKIQ
jgi:DNA primase